MIKTKKEAFAIHSGFALDEVNDYRYHEGKTSIPVWALDDGFYCVTKGFQATAKHPDIDWEWTEVKDDYLNKSGYRIWKTISNY